MHDLSHAAIGGQSWRFKDKLTAGEVPPKRPQPYAIKGITWRLACLTNTDSPHEIIDFRSFRSEAVKISSAVARASPGVRGKAWITITPRGITSPPSTDTRFRSTHTTNNAGLSARTTSATIAKPP